MKITRLATLALAPVVAGSILTGAGTAQAQSVYDPTPSDITTPSPVDSGHFVADAKIVTGDTRSHLAFRASKKTVSMAHSTSAPKKVHGRWSMGAAQPVVLQGTAGAPGGVTIDPSIGNYSFDQWLMGLTPGTRYYLLVTVPTSPTSLPVQKLLTYDTTLLANGKTDKTDVWAKHHFVSNRKQVQFRWGTTDVAAQTNPAQTLTGKRISANGSPAKYEFSRELTGLKPATKYYTRLDTAASSSELADNQGGNFYTKTRHVTATVKSIHVIDDADGFGRGAGDLSFYLRINKTLDPSEQTQWSGKSDTMSIKSGHTATKFGRNLYQGKDNPASKLLLLVQGVEDDTLPTTKKACHLNDYFGHTSHAQQASKSMCYDASFAEGIVNLPTGRYTGTHTQIAHLQVYRSPALRFTAEVVVETSYS